MTYQGENNITGGELTGGEGQGQVTYVYSSIYMQNTFINHLLRNSSASVSGSSWIALYHEENGIAQEITGGSYTRIKTTGSWSISSTGSSAYNTWDIYFPTATSDWGKVTHLGILNGSQAGVNSGSILFYGPLSGSRLIGTGDVFAFFAKDIEIRWYRGYSYYSGSRLINHWLNNKTFSTPGTGVWCALYITMPYATGTGGFEVSGSTGYARIRVGGTGSWVVPASGSTSNIFDIIYTTGLSVPNDWGTLGGFCLLDAVSSGNLLYRGEIFPQISVIGPDGMAFYKGDLQIKSDIGYVDIPVV